MPELLSKSEQERIKIGPNDVKAGMYVAIGTRRDRYAVRVLKVTATQIVCAGLSGRGERRFRKANKWQGPNTFPCYPVGRSYGFYERTQIVGFASEVETAAAIAEELRAAEWDRRQKLCRELSGDGASVSVQEDLYEFKVQGLTDQQVKDLAGKFNLWKRGETA